ncbi:hypothetical protein R1flu_019221 [Riccia fluitans]|uniref:DUF4097 domain-containing protein n=1 Tax=Riccia fluitans TaxID=41844 RepID=A0ABD1ZI83_9MARC
MFRLALRKARGLGCGGQWNVPTICANLLGQQAGFISQKSDTPALDRDSWVNEYNLGKAESRKQVQRCGNVRCRMSHFSSGSHAERVKTPSFPRRMAVQVGTLLKIDLSGTKAGVKAVVGDNLEEIVIKPSWSDSSDESAQCEALSISHSQDIVSLKKSEPLDQLSKLQELSVHIPARWCSLDIHTSEGPVYIQNVREGRVRVITGGGNVKLGEVKGGEAFIETHGGEFEAKVLQAGAKVNTKGGKLHVDKLQGDIINLDSGGSLVAIGTLYGNDVIVQSAGGALKARHIQAQQMAHISSDGGPMMINGFDGNGIFISNGGKIELQLSEHAQEVHIDASDGDVVLSLSSKLTAQLTYKGAQGPVQLDSSLSSTGVPNVYHYSGSESVAPRLGQDLGWRGSENDLRSADKDTIPCKIVVSTLGELLVKQKGWLDLI